MKAPVSADDTHCLPLRPLGIPQTSSSALTLSIGHQARSLGGILDFVWHPSISRCHPPPWPPTLPRVRPSPPHPCRNLWAGLPAFPPWPCPSPALALPQSNLPVPTPQYCRPLGEGVGWPVWPLPVSPGLTSLHLPSSEPCTSPKQSGLFFLHQRQDYSTSQTLMVNLMK